MAYPGVSVVIPAYNSAATILRALDSVAAQTLPATEIIVVDDASFDATAEIVQNYNKLHVKLVRLEKNVGAAEARNQGVRNATAELIAFLDADDEWLPTKLEKQVALITSDQDFTFVSCRSNLIAPTGEDLGDAFERNYAAASGPEAWKALLRDNFVTTPSVLVWRHVFERLGGFNPKLKIAEDQDMWIRLAEAGSLGYVSECLIYVHEQATSISGGPFSDQTRYTLPMLEGHLTRLRSKLSDRELTEIRGSRLLRLGQLAYSRGERTVGRELIVQTITMGYRPWAGLFFLANASRLATRLKKWLLRK